MSSFIDNFTSTDWLKQMKRADAFPLDKSCIFSSLEDAKKYAKQDANDLDSRKLAMTSYIGQILAIYENDNVSCYIIDENRNLAPIGDGIRYKGELEVDQPAITNISNPNIGDLYKIKLVEDSALPNAYIPQTMNNVYDIFGSYFDGCIKKYKFGNDTDYTDCYVLINDGNYDNGMCKKFVENKIFDMGSKLHICYTDPDAGKLTQTVTISEIRYESNQYIFIVTNSSSDNTILSKFQEGQGNSIGIGIESIEFDTSVNDGDYILYNGEYFELFLDDLARKDDVNTSIENNISFGGEKTFSELSNDESLKKEKVLYKIYNNSDVLYGGEIKIYSYQNDNPTDTGTYTISETSPKYTIKYSAENYSDPSNYPDLQKLINVCDIGYTIEYSIPFRSSTWTGTTVIGDRNGPTLILPDKLDKTIDDNDIASGTTVTITKVYKRVFAYNGDCVMWNGTTWTTLSHSIEPVNTLTSTNGYEVLSALQGKVLNDKINEINKDAINALHYKESNNTSGFYITDHSVISDLVALKLQVPGNITMISNTDFNCISYTGTNGTKTLQEELDKKANKTDLASVYKIKGSTTEKDINEMTVDRSNGNVYNISEITTGELSNTYLFFKDVNTQGIDVSCMVKTISDKPTYLFYTSTNELENKCGVGDTLIISYNNINTEFTVTFVGGNATWERTGVQCSLTSDSTTIVDGVTCKAMEIDRSTKTTVAVGDNVVWIDGYGWDKLAAGIDLSGYVTKSSLQENVNTNFLTSPEIATGKITINSFDNIQDISQAPDKITSLKEVLDNKVDTTSDKLLTEDNKKIVNKLQLNEFDEGYQLEVKDGEFKATMGEFTGGIQVPNAYSLIIGRDLSQTLGHALDAKANKSDIASVYKVKGSFDPNSNSSPNVKNFSFGSTLKNGDVYNISDDITNDSITGIANSVWYDTTIGLPECTYTTDESSSNIAYLEFTDKSYNNMIGNCKLVLATNQAAINTVTIDTVYGLDTANNKIAIKASSELTSGTKYYLYHIERDRVPVKKGDNVVWIDNYGWDKLASDVDLSGYYTKDETNTLLDAKANTAELQEIIDATCDTEILSGGNYNLLKINDISYLSRLQDGTEGITTSTAQNVVTDWLPVKYGKYYSLTILYNGQRCSYVSGGIGTIISVVRMNIKKTDGSIVVYDKDSDEMSTAYKSNGTTGSWFTIPIEDVSEVRLHINTASVNEQLDISSITKFKAYEPMITEGDTGAKAYEKSVSSEYIDGAESVPAVTKYTLKHDSTKMDKVTLSPYIRNVDYGVVPFSYYKGVNDTYPDTFTRNTTYASYIAAWKNMVSTHTGYVTETNLGKASDDQDIYLYDFKPVQITNQKTSIPKIIIVAGQHGFEKSNIYGLYYFIDNLLNRWNKHSALEYLRNHVELMVIPVLNTYGFDNLTYKNKNGVNLNRNYDSHWELGTDTTSEQYGGTAPFDQPETQIVKTLLQNNTDASLVVDFHTNGSAAVAQYSYINYYGVCESTDSYYNRLVDAVSYQLASISANFNLDYELNQPDTILGFLNNSHGTGLLRDYVTDNNMVGMLLEGFNGFPNDTAFVGKVYKANEEILVNWLTTAINYLSK